MSQSLNSGLLDDRPKAIQLETLKTSSPEAKPEASKVLKTIASLTPGLGVISPVWGFIIGGLIG